jgi:parvulin-like peptidyl-prolyl isomerase
VNGHPISERELKRMLADPTMQRRAARRDLQRQQTSAGRAPAEVESEPERNELERIALRRLILVRLLLEEAARLELKVTDDELGKSKEAVRRGFEDPTSFAQWRKALDVEDDQSLADALRTELLVERVSALLTQNVAVRAEEVDSYYGANTAQFSVPATVNLLTIEAGDQKSADEILRELKKPGADFEAVAAKRSKDFGSARAAPAGWISINKVPAEIQAAVANLKPGQISGPVQTDGGLLIVKLVDRKPARIRELAEVRPAIERSLLRTRQGEAIRSWLATREGNAKVEILVPALRPVAASGATKTAGRAEQAALERWTTSPSR